MRSVAGAVVAVWDWIWDWISDNAAPLGAVLTFVGLVLKVVRLPPNFAKVRSLLTAGSFLAIGFAVGVVAYAFAPWELIAEPRVSLSETPPRVMVVEPSETLNRISGKITGILNPRRFKLVLYAYTNQWYVQPFEQQPFTEVHANGAFSGMTHEGERYAILVVRPEFAPPTSVPSLPTTDDEVIAAFEFDGR